MCHQHWWLNTLLWWEARGNAVTEMEMSRADWRRWWTETSDGNCVRIGTAVSRISVFLFRLTAGIAFQMGDASTFCIRYSYSLWKHRRTDIFVWKSQMQSRLSALADRWENPDGQKAKCTSTHSSTEISPKRWRTRIRTIRNEIEWIQCTWIGMKTYTYEENRVRPMLRTWMQCLFNLPATGIETRAFADENSAIQTSTWFLSGLPVTVTKII